MPYYQNFPTPQKKEMDIKMDTTAENVEAILSTTPERRLILVALLLIVFVLVTSVKLGKRNIKQSQD